MIINKNIQITRLGDVTGGEFKIPPHTFLLKNITDDDLKVTVQLADDTDPIETVMQPGWNPEVCRKVLDAAGGTLQYGY